MGDRDQLGIIVALVAVLIIVAIARMPYPKPSAPDLCRCGVACECADPAREER